MEKITNLSSEKVDKATLDLEVLKLKKYFQSLISQTIADFNQRLDVIQKKIDDMQTISRSSKKSMKSTTKKIPTTSSSTPKAVSNKETTLLKPGSIDEQDLPE